jgi:hypothetical protein
MSLNFDSTNHIKGHFTRPLTEEELEKARQQMRKFKTSLLQSKKNAEEIIYQCTACFIIVMAVNMKPLYSLCPICAEHLN